MKIRHVLLVLALVACNGLPARADTIVIRGGTLIDATGAAPRPNIRIVIDNGTIKDIWTGDQDRREPAGATVIDASDKFILPGFIDSHVHYREYMGELFLSHGVTTVFDLGNPYHWQRAVREALNDGRFHGPRFFFCGGPVLSRSAEADVPSISRRGDTFGVIERPQDAKAIINAVKQKSDCLKLSEEFPGPLFSALAREAKAAGLAVISHSLQAMHSADWGITGLEHMVGVAIATMRSPEAKQAIAGKPIPAGHKNSLLYQWMQPEHFDEVVRYLVDRGVYINPTLAFEWKALTDRAETHESEDARLLNRPDLQHVPLDERLLTLGQYHWPDQRAPADKERFVKGYRNVQEFLRRFTKAGGKLYAGTDSAAATTPGLSLHHEMELLVDAGVPPLQAIQASTKFGAELLGLDDRLGTVEAGKWADLIVVRGNPLDDIRNTKAIDIVIKAGQRVDMRYDPAHVLPIAHPGPITKHLYNPMPQVRDVMPPVARRGETLTLRITGRGFVPGSVVTFGQRALESKTISATELDVHLPASATSETGSFFVSVQNPKPGGGDSNAVIFIVTAR